MEQTKSLIISYEKQTIEVTITKELHTFSTLKQLIKDEFTLQTNFNIYTSDTNTLINESNYTEAIITSNDKATEMHIQLTQNTDVNEDEDDENLEDKLNQMLSQDNFINDVPKPTSTNNNNNSNSNNALSSYSKESEMIMRTGIILEKQFPQDKCTLCDDSIAQYKYICTICEECVLCEECELEHDHPVIRFKEHFVGKNNKKEILSLIKTCSKENYSSKAPILSSYISLSNDLINNTISIGPHVKKQFCIEIHNKTQSVLTKNTFRLIAKDYKDLQLKFDGLINEDIEPKEKKKIKINITSGKKEGIYEIYFYFLTSFEHKLAKIYSCPLKIKVNVINDEEEISLSGFFTDYPEIQLLPKELLLKVYSVVNEKLSTKPPNEVYAILKKNKWNIEHAIEDLTKD